MPKNRETRIAAETEVRAEDSDGFNIVGYAAKFNKRTEIYPGYFEVIAPGAFKRTINQKADVRLLYNHNPDTVMARTKAGTLELTEDEIGLKFRAKVSFADQDGARVIQKIKDGNISQCSFAFSVDGADGEEFKTLDGQDEKQLRTLKRLVLYDVSPVTYPQYEDTEVVARAAFQNAPEQWMKRESRDTDPASCPMADSDDDGATMSQRDALNVLFLETL